MNVHVFYNCCKVIILEISVGYSYETVKIIRFTVYNFLFLGMWSYFAPNGGCKISHYSHVTKKIDMNEGLLFDKYD